MKFLVVNVCLVLSMLLVNCDNHDSLDEEKLYEWTKQSDIPSDLLRLNADVITYDNAAYLLPGKGGTRHSARPELLKFSDNEWTELATFDGIATAGNSGSIRYNDVIYIFGGVNGSSFATDQVKSYSITEDTFAEVTSFPSIEIRAYSKTKAYFGNDEEFLSYDFETAAIEALPLIPMDLSIVSANITVEGDRIYALFSFLDTDNFFVFDAQTKEWMQLTDFPGEIRSGSSMLSSHTDVYIGLGFNQTELSDIWKYNIANDSWVEFSQYPGTHFTSGFSFELDNQLYFGGGYKGHGAISTDLLNEEMYSIQIK